MKQTTVANALYKHPTRVR